MKCKTCGTDHRGVARHGGYCLDHQERRAESAEAEAAALRQELDNLSELLDKSLNDERTLREQLAQITRERDAAKNEIRRLDTFLETIINIGNTEIHIAFDGERHREMRHCAMQALATNNEEYRP